MCCHISGIQGQRPVEVSQRPAVLPQLAQRVAGAAALLGSSAAALLMCHNREDAEYLKSLHDPIVLGRIPNRVDDPRGFETATGMAEMQKQILSQLKTVS